MKNITVLNYKGQEFTGSWNGKAYSSKVEGREDLHRIYVDSNPIHIEDTELKRLQSEDGKRQQRIALEKSGEFFDWLEGQPDDIKKQVFLQALDAMREMSKGAESRKAVNALRCYFGK